VVADTGPGRGINAETQRDAEKRREVIFAFAGGGTGLTADTPLDDTEGGADRGQAVPTSMLGQKLQSGR